MITNNKCFLKVEKEASTVFTVVNLQHELLQILQDFYSALLENMIALRRYCI